MDTTSNYTYTDARYKCNDQLNRISFILNMIKDNQNISELERRFLIKGRHKLKIIYIEVGDYFSEEIKEDIEKVIIRLDSCIMILKEINGELNVSTMIVIESIIKDLVEIIKANSHSTSNIPYHHRLF